jgi:hypothetical protein
MFFVIQMSLIKQKPANGSAVSNHKKAAQFEAAFLMCIWI